MIVSTIRPRPALTVHEAPSKGPRFGAQMGGMPGLWISPFYSPAQRDTASEARFELLRVLLAHREAR